MTGLWMLLWNPSEKFYFIQKELRQNFLFLFISLFIIFKTTSMCLLLGFLIWIFRWFFSFLNNSRWPLLNLPVKSKAEIILLFSVTHVHVYFCSLLFFGIYLQKKQQAGRNDQIFVSANFSNLNDASLHLKASKVFFHFVELWQTYNGLGNHRKLVLILLFIILYILSNQMHCY